MRNISVKADNVGDTLPASDFNANLRSELQNVCTSAGFTLDPEGGPDTDVEMLGKSITQYSNAAQYYQDSGAANSYVLSRVGTLKALTSYIDGVVVIFKAGNANTGASTINVDSLGSKDLVDSAGSALVGGEITLNGYVLARYNSSTDDFEIVVSKEASQFPSPVSGEEYKSLQVKSDYSGFELVGPLTSFKNKIINGNFEVWEYDDTQTTDGYGSDNRWFNGHSGSTKTHSQQDFTVGQTDVPGNPDYYSRTVVTTAGTTSSFVYKSQRIEGVSTFQGQDATLSFWAKADASRDVAVEFAQSFGSGGSTTVNSIGVTTVSLTSSWAKHTVTVSLPSISGKTVGDDNYLAILIWMDAGSNYNSRTNSLGNQSGTFDISRVQFEAGDVETEFEGRNVSIENLLCNRYFYLLHWTGAVYEFGCGVNTDASNCRGIIANSTQVPMRTSTPTATVVSGTYNSLTNSNTTLSTLTIAPRMYGRLVYFSGTAPGTLPSGSGMVLRSSGVAIITLSSEL